MLEKFADDVLAKDGHVDVLINNAMPLFKVIDECSYEEFTYAQAVGVTAPFYLAKLFKNHFAEGASIINISSSRDRMSQPQTESYTAAKGGIAALTHALAVSLAGRVRVNSISPGWIDTAFRTYEGADASQQPAGRVGNPLDIANMVLYLASEKAGFITGENICIDGGMTHQMIYHNDFGWRRVYSSPGVGRTRVWGDFAKDGMATCSSPRCGWPCSVHARVSWRRRRRGRRAAVRRPRMSWRWPRGA